MKIVVQVEYRASSSRSKHEGESSFGLCDRLSRTRDNSQRQLPTDQDYAVSTREYQTDQSSLKTAPTAARSVLEKRRKQRQQQTHRLRRLTRSLHIRPIHSSSPIPCRRPMSASHHGSRLNGRIGESAHQMRFSRSAAPFTRIAKVPGFPSNVPGWHSIRPRVRAGQICQPFARGVPSYA
jgi:hypothetical protein